MWEVYLINNIDFIVDMVHHYIRGDAGRQSERQIRKPVPWVEDQRSAEELLSEEESVHLLSKF